jgi:hypothetical protein
MIFLALIINVPGGMFAQVTFTRHVIDSTTITWPYDVCAVDLDQDNDVDVLAALATDDQIVWFENNGNQIFTKHVVADTIDMAVSVHFLDMEPDGDIDVVGTSQSHNQV